MSTTVTYKGNTLATVSNNTKTLKTAGKYMEGDVVLTDVSQSAPTIQSLSVTPSETAQTFNASGVDGYKPVSVSAISSTYVGSGIARKSSTDLTVSGATITIPAGYYANEISKDINTGYLDDSSIIYNSIGAWEGYITITSKVKTGGYLATNSTHNNLVELSTILPIQSSKTITPTESAQTAVTQYKWTTGAITVGAISSTYVGSGIDRQDSDSIENLLDAENGINIPAGYYSEDAWFSVSEAYHSNPTISVSATGLITASHTQNKGYVSTGRAGTTTATQQLTTKAAATITPTTTNQTIAAGTYLTGTQTIAGDADLVGSNILSTANIFGVQGTVDFIDVYIRSAAPTSSVGSDGDIYIQE